MSNKSKVTIDKTSCCGSSYLSKRIIIISPDSKSWLIWKDPDAGKDWGQEEKGTTEDEVVGWHHWLNGHGFGWTPGVGDGQGGLACWGSWGRKESDTTEWATWTEAIKPVWHNWACVPEPGLCDRWAHIPQPLKPECPRACDTQEKPPQQEAFAL